MRVIISALVVFALAAGAGAPAPPNPQQQPPPAAGRTAAAAGRPGTGSRWSRRQRSVRRPDAGEREIVTGGPFHDYTGQSKILMDTLNAVMPINWTVVQGMSNLAVGKLPLYENPDGPRGWTSSSTTNAGPNGDLPARIVQNITRANVPRMFLHCTLHSYRVMTDDCWWELIGMTSRRHTRSHNILLKWADGDPITAGLPPFVTPIDELYVIEKVWPNTKALATAVSPEDGVTYPLVWTHDYRGARVFGTTLGHGNETFHTNQFKELLTRGFRWALKKEPIALPPPAAPARGGGPGRGGGQ